MSAWGTRNAARARPWIRKGVDTLVPGKDNIHDDIDMSIMLVMMNIIIIIIRIIIKIPTKNN